MKVSEFKKDTHSTSNMFYPRILKWKVDFNLTVFFFKF